MRDYASLLPVTLDLDLIEAGWNGATCTYPGMSIRQHTMVSLRNSLLKKFEDEKDVDADRNALALFMKVNAACETYPGCNLINSIEAEALGEAREFIARFFDYPETGCILNLGSIASGFGFGAGSNVGSKYTDFYTKIGNSYLSYVNPVLYDFYMEAIRSDNLWSSVESTRRKGKKTECVSGNRLSFVPKTRLISRTICTEPLLNMLFQKGIESVLVRRLRQVVGIDLAIQQKRNRFLARRGSLTGEFGTIDLSSASDSMSLALVNEMIPRQVRYWLELTRSPMTVLPDGSKLDLHMVSSMGNAFTFPLQTIFFASLVYGAYRVHGIPFHRPCGRSMGNFAVYGDDIIVVSKAYDLVTRLLSISGFTVNVDKSFNTGAFRESCGADFCSGYNVRGVYIKSLKHPTDVYSAINRLNVWTATHGILLQNTVRLLARGVKKLYVPFEEMDVSGIKVPSAMVRNYPRKRPYLGIVYRVLKIRASNYDVSDVEKRPVKLAGWVDNHPAYLMCALAGYFRKGSVTHRSRRVRISVKTRYSSRWDYISPDPHIRVGFVERWKSFVELNLLG